MAINLTAHTPKLSSLEKQFRLNSVTMVQSNVLVIKFMIFGFSSYQEEGMVQTTYIHIISNLAFLLVLQKTALGEWRL